MIEPEEILRRVLALDRHLRREAYYGERAAFYNPGGVAPLGVIVASVKDRDGPNDAAARLSRPGVYRFALGIGRGAFERRFGAVPPRPPKGGALRLPDHDLTRLDALTPHPVYAWMSWVQILSPSEQSFTKLAPLLDEALGLARARWNRHHGDPGARG